MSFPICRNVVVPLALAVLLSLPFWAVVVGQPVGRDSTSNIWEAVSAKAAASEDRKTLWRELKKLSPEDLLLCGEQFCLSCKDQPEKPDLWSVIITVNAILSYHKDKTSYEQTAQAVGKIIETSTTSTWIYGAMEWIENNDHFKHIPEAGMKSIAAGIEVCLDDATKPDAVKTIVLKKASSYDIFSNLPAKARLRITDKCRAIAAEGRDPEVVKQANRAVKDMEELLEGIDAEGGK